ncbi:MAG: hypothetical protein BWY31_02010 [Lentisphaerae bacterium ADurb.Bin242]|nr:MAG: hypothetical protein BWY31_02010 [Lentisphaerae bacterium ADurb.Bin242]
MTKRTKTGSRSEKKSDFLPGNGLKPCSAYHQGKEVNDSDRFVPFDVKWPRKSKSPADVRFLLEAPAGKSGWITVKDGHLAYPDGKRFRVYGVNITNRGAVPGHDSSVRIAENLARCGINCVRMGPAEALLVPDSDCRAIDPQSMDKFDFLAAELKKRGIYIYLRLDYGIRGFKSGDGIPDCGYPALYFDSRYQRCHREYARQLLAHENPYTGLKYSEDPAVLFVELTNEMSIVEFWERDVIQQRLKEPPAECAVKEAEWTTRQNCMPLEYAQEFLRLYNDWLSVNIPPDTRKRWRKENSISADSLIPLLDIQERAQAPKERFHAEIGFVMDLERKFFLSTRDFLRRELGIRSLLIGNSNFGHGTCSLALISGTSLLDVVDTHFYWEHPYPSPNSTIDEFYNYRDQCIRENTPMVDNPELPFPAIPCSALEGKPLLMSEYNSPFPQEFAAEAIPMYSAYAAFQDMDGIILHTLCNRDIITKPGPVGRPFDIAKDPQKMSQLAAGALIFLRADVRKARETRTCSFSPDQVKEAIRNRDWYPLEKRLVFRHRIRIASLNGPEISCCDTAAVENPAISDTNELTLFFGSPLFHRKNMTGYFTIDTGRTQVLAGFINRHRLPLKNISVETEALFCAITVSSLDGKAISESEKLYVTANVRVANTHMRWSADRRITEVWGTGPVRIEPWSGTLFLRGIKNAGRAVLIPLNSDGSVMSGKRIIPIEAGKCSLPLKAVTNAYIVYLEPGRRACSEDSKPSRG